MSRPGSRWLRAAVLAVVVGVGAVACAEAPLPDVLTGDQPREAATPAQAAPGRVVRVADGDTLTVLRGGREEKVRLLGIDTPELAHGADKAECGGPQARVALAAAVLGREVQVVPDPRADARDRFGRLLGYVETVDGEDAGLSLIEQGMAETWRPKSAPQPSRWAAYQRAQRKAQEAEAGNWAVCPSLVGRPQR